MCELIALGNSGVLSPEEWLASNICNGEPVGFDPSVLSHSLYLKYSEVLVYYVAIRFATMLFVRVQKAMENGCGGLLQGLDCNLVDEVWGDARPPLPNNAVIILGMEYAGKIGN